MMAASEHYTNVTPLHASADSAFDYLFRNEYDSLVRLAYLMVGTQAVAEELTQEAFTELYRKQPSVLNPGGFVRTVLVRRCQDVKRREVRRRTAQRLIRPTVHVEPERHHLVDALATLPDNWRAMIVLRYYGGHTINEIAEITGSAEGTVKSGIHRALTELRSLLDE